VLCVDLDPRHSLTRWLLPDDAVPGVAPSSARNPTIVFVATHAERWLSGARARPALLPVVRFSDPAPGGHGWASPTWKLPSVQRFADERSLAWVDDDLHSDACAWAALRRIPIKLIGMDGRIVLTDDHAGNPERSR
jgi:hypothetical protein